MTTTKSTSAKTAATQTRSKLEGFLTNLLGGMENDLPATVDTMSLNGDEMTPSEVEAGLQAGLTAFANVATAKAAYAKAVLDAKAAEVTARALAHSLEAWLKVQFGTGNVDMLGKFGVTVPAPKKPSVASKAVGLAKRAAKLQAKRTAAAAAAEAANPSTPIVAGANGVQLAAPVVLAAPAAGVVAAK